MGGAGRSHVLAAQRCALALLPLLAACPQLAQNLLGNLRACRTASHALFLLTALELGRAAQSLSRRHHSTSFASLPQAAAAMGAAGGEGVGASVLQAQFHAQLAALSALQAGTLPDESTVLAACRGRAPAAVWRLLVPAIVWPCADSKECLLEHPTGHTCCPRAGRGAGTGSGSAAAAVAAAAAAAATVTAAGRWCWASSTSSRSVSCRRRRWRAAAA